MMNGSKRVTKVTLGLIISVALVLVVVLSTLAQGPVQNPTVMGILPNRGPNTGSLSVTISGTGFQDGASVKLTRAGQADINATGVLVVSASQITGRLNLIHAQPGAWSVVVTNPDAQSGTLADGFTVTALVFLPSVTRNWSEEEPPPPPSCEGLGAVQNWTGQVTFSFATSASSGGESISYHHSATVNLQMGPDYQNSLYVGWKDVSVTGTGEVNDIHTDPPDFIETLVGSGALYPGGPTQDDPKARLGVWLDTCRFEFFLQTLMSAEYTAYDETVTVPTGVGTMDINDIPAAQLTGSRTVPAVWYPIDEPSWFVPSGVLDSELELMVGNDFGQATVSWSFAPAD